MNAEAIPLDLRERPQWVVWRYELREDGKRTKVPYRPSGRDRRASVTDPALGGFERRTSSPRAPTDRATRSPPTTHLLPRPGRRALRPTGAIISQVERTWNARCPATVPRHRRGPAEQQRRHPQRLGASTRPATWGDRRARSRAPRDIEERRPARHRARPLSAERQERSTRPWAAPLGGNGSPEPVRQTGATRIFSNEPPGSQRHEARTAVARGHAGYTPGRRRTSRCAAMLAFWTGGDPGRSTTSSAAGLMREKWERPDYPGTDDRRGARGTGRVLHPGTVSGLQDS